MTDSPIDHEIFSELKYATGEEFAAELVNTFLDEAPGMIDELKAAAGASDTDRYRRAAHSIKSNANTFGATALADLAKDVELGNLPEAGDLADAEALEAALNTAVAALRSLIDD
ncbi:hybrid sensory histidine kinase TorS [Ruegeria denitrificans]|uniref:Hybrid sensory histidine kinase TorS n=1 Tax=Ruegeria denitrificans TaxID=1715692 RepID=A0A0P1IIS0_9RHOB|nr:Hpt domain-containing protein [Ruegeria denitrificans]CUK04206.1 hybrid sensory histidine kinase TorS [Ruegeria denitrificans]